MFEKRYVDQVGLLVSVLPHIADEQDFALKGGTAINLFYHEMPRLSVDIDLVYLPISERSVSLNSINNILERIKMRIDGVRGHSASRSRGGDALDTRVIAHKGSAEIKIETSPVTRGTVLPCRTMEICGTAMKQFGYTKTKVAAFEEIYGSKIVAALDRQHPRDLFDINLLYENEGLTDLIFRIFMVYVASSGTPMHVLLAPNLKPIKHLFETRFAGMTSNGISLEKLEDARRRLISEIGTRLTGDAAKFLTSLHSAEPDFDLLGLPSNIAVDPMNLPAVKWKIMNLDIFKRRDPERHKRQMDALQALFR